MALLRRFSAPLSIFAPVVVFACTGCSAPVEEADASDAALVAPAPAPARMTRLDGYTVDELVRAHAVAITPQIVACLPGSSTINWDAHQEMAMSPLEIPCPAAARVTLELMLADSGRPIPIDAGLQAKVEAWSRLEVDRGFANGSSYLDDAGFLEPRPWNSVFDDASDALHAQKVRERGRPVGGAPLHEVLAEWRGLGRHVMLRPMRVEGAPPTVDEVRATEPRFIGEVALRATGAEAVDAFGARVHRDAPAWPAFAGTLKSDAVRASWLFEGDEPGSDNLRRSTLVVFDASGQLWGATHLSPR